jgi:hypothetical protein
MIWLPVHCRIETPHFSIQAVRTDVMLPPLDSTSASANFYHLTVTFFNSFTSTFFWQNLCQFATARSTYIIMAQQPATEDQQPHPLRDFKEYQNALFAALTGATRAANAIPISDLGYYRSLDRDFAKTLDSCSEKVLKLSNNMLKYASVDEPESSQRFHDVDDVLDRYGVAIDVVDNLLEKAVS